MGSMTCKHGRGLEPPIALAPGTQCECCRNWFSWSGMVRPKLCPACKSGSCSDPECDCHTDPTCRVATPFPLGLGNPYCCNKCAIVPVKGS